ncbi:MAG: carboxypeptidase-like regulatory domain-containing protein, partial [Chitinophagaceae bacterium]
MRLFFFFLLYFINITILKAQTEVSGWVKDAKGHPIAGASISMKDSYDGGVSDSTGKFRFTTTEKGQKLIVVTAIGYKGFEQNINLDAPLSPLNFSMKEEFDEMKAVVITAGTFEASDKKRTTV